MTDIFKFWRREAPVLGREARVLALSTVSKILRTELSVNEFVKTVFYDTEVICIEKVNQKINVRIVKEHVL